MAQTIETSLPLLGQDGDLPSGVYRTTLRDTLDRFEQETNAWHQRFLEGDDDYVGLADGAQHGLPARAAARAVLGFIRQGVCLRFGEFCFRTLQNLKQMHSRSLPHLLKPLHRHHGQLGVCPGVQ